MFPQLTNTDKAVGFFAIALALAVVIALMPNGPVHLYMTTPLVAAVMSGFTVGATPPVSEYLAGERWLLTNLGYAMLMGWLFYRWSKRERPARGNAATQPATEIAR